MKKEKANINWDLVIKAKVSGKIKKVTLDELGWFAYTAKYERLMWYDGYLMAFDVTFDSINIFDKRCKPQNANGITLYLVSYPIIVYVPNCKPYKLLEYDLLEHKAKLVDIPANNIIDIDNKFYCPIVLQPLLASELALKEIKKFEKGDKDA